MLTAASEVRWWRTDAVLSINLKQPSTYADVRLNSRGEAREF